MANQRFISAAVDATGTLWRDDAPDEVLPWWSFTKTLIAACLLLRAEEGVLDLDAALPGKPYSLRHLLAHSSGLRDYGTVGRYHAAVEAGEDPWPVGQMLEEARADDLLWEPGAGWRYSNIGYMQARFALEVSEGADLGTIVARRLALPLGVQSVRLARMPRDFSGLVWDSGGYHPGWVYHGCMMGNAADATRILHGILVGGLLSSNLVDQMTALHMHGGGIEGRPWRRTGYGLGLMIGQVESGATILGHSGCGPFSANHVAHFPDQGVTVASFVQGGDETPAEWETLRVAACR
ncbi:D-alanyl-D-alanine carboxypeptidase precursor [Thalassovita gelatinovora]|uniref:D-alanyl-D-alanine carboxypeptidase n=1 Tax=Thalassovita gelatinovora TaxID=53501 RepID=A0A0P1F5R0_THAGE|nr:serine hydrolase domain-containing protein [Thalassovita gelatinovora]QIZ80832.1 beta-lactamase family protein [Thalassovita gelatinovora]CUH63253.1 D-alanyl-D-alanine carboxypeptidase precursor [Thalassovita gelatinovora]SEQ64126.1 CubicO group peptidase, beta-lactamase class C family [Thalassovita gelatinovora]